MHGMLSLTVLVAAFVGLAGWAGYLSVRLYRACPAGQSQSRQPATATHLSSETTPATRPGLITDASPVLATADTFPAPAGTATPAATADEHAPSSHPVA
jgi:hypothetical protein